MEFYQLLEIIYINTIYTIDKINVITDLDKMRIEISQGLSSSHCCTAIFRSANLCATRFP